MFEINYFIFFLVLTNCLINCQRFRRTTTESNDYDFSDDYDFDEITTRSVVPTLRTDTITRNIPIRAIPSQSTRATARATLGTPSRQVSNATPATPQPVVRLASGQRPPRDGISCKDFFIVIVIQINFILSQIFQSNINSFKCDFIEKYDTMSESFLFLPGICKSCEQANIFYSL